MNNSCSTCKPRVGWGFSSILMLALLTAWTGDARAEKNSQHSGVTPAASKNSKTARMHARDEAPGVDASTLVSSFRAMLTQHDQLSERSASPHEPPDKKDKKDKKDKDDEKDDQDDQNQQGE